MEEKFRRNGKDKNASLDRISTNYRSNFVITSKLLVIHESNNKKMIFKSHQKKWLLKSLSNGWMTIKSAKI